jgi:hypothetical protein
MNKLSKHIFVILLLSCISCAAFAQRRLMPGMRQEYYFRRQNPMPPGNRMPNNIKKVQRVKEEFLSRQLDLTPDQASRFWPTYRQYQDELWNVKRLKRLNNSDAQANGADQINRDLQYETELVNIKKHYTDAFLKILPPEKVSLLDKSERAFNDELIRQVHEQKAGTPY